MESYRNIWNNFLNYLREHWSLKNAELIESHHIEAYMYYKIEYYPSVQYIQKISSAFGKLEIALKYFTKEIYGTEKHYDFSIRQDILDSSRDLKQVANNYRNRTYKFPKQLISHLKDFKHRLAASIQLEGGARIEGVAFIKKKQLMGYDMDKVTNMKKGVITTKEKGGKVGDVYICTKTYEALVEYFRSNKQFRLNRQKYYDDIKQACVIARETPEGTHGFRWNFAKNRMMEYANADYSYADSLVNVSAQMKHNRADITEHYLGG